MWLALTTWFTTSKIGRWIAAIGAAVVAVLLVLWRVYVAGKEAVRAQQERRALEDARIRRDVEDEVGKMSVDQLRRSAARWVRPNDKGGV